MVTAIQDLGRVLSSVKYSYVLRSEVLCIKL
jgi:hypothetical protein